MEFLSSVPAHGELVRIRLGPVPVCLATTPELAWRILAVDAGKFAKGIVFIVFIVFTERAAKVPKGAYLPFGAGARLCPGHFLAPAEIAIVAATIGARWRLVPAGGKKVHAKVKATMQPNRLPVKVLPRHG